MVKNKFLKSNSKLIEIGSNDGTFLSNFKNSNINYIGFEPSENVAIKAKENNVKTIKEHDKMKTTYSVYSTEYDKLFAYCEKSSTLIQKLAS